MNATEIEPGMNSDLRHETVLAAYFDDEERLLEPPLSYRTARPLGLAGLQEVLSGALLAQAASLEISLSASPEQRGEFLARARALYRFAEAAVVAGIERVTLRRSTASGRWLEVRVNSRPSGSPGGR